MAEKKKGMLRKVWEEVISPITGKDSTGNTTEKPAPKIEKPVYKEPTNIDRMKEKQEALKELKEYKKGGMVKKTGPAKLHKGERVLTVAQTKVFNKPGSKQTVKPSAGKASKKR